LGNFDWLTEQELLIGINTTNLYKMHACILVNYK